MEEGASIVDSKEETQAMDGTAEVAEPTPLTLRYSEDKLLKRLLAQVAALSHSEYQLTSK